MMRRVIPAYSKKDSQNLPVPESGENLERVRLPACVPWDDHVDWLPAKYLA